MPIPEKIAQLVERFGENLADYKYGAYNETQTRREFIDPFFHALGWDMDNSQGRPESQKEVIHEAKITIEDAVKAPDYCFLIDKTPKFFVEAKKPSVCIKDSIHPAYQLRRYGWSAKLPVSILTDFEEFAVYDCRIMPEQQDHAARARLWYLTFDEYLAKWDDLAALFSRDAIANGSLDHYVETRKDKRGALPVDVAFLQDIERWREQLAQHLAARNPGLTRRELNYAVQLTIDRMIFLRICEDRGIEPYGKLRALRDQSNMYGLLLKRFYEADAKYDSGIFHFKQERGQRDAPDTLTPNLTIDDDALRGMLARLYYPESPYAFEVIPAEILGQVYEQFLGKVICLDAAHRATVEEKPDVKKAGGVYYTPAYIVDYIVAQTVGALLRGNTLKQADTLTILDPACGSGSFLIGAYGFLLDWHLDTYLADDPKKWSKTKPPRLRQIGNGWTLTIAERKRILLAHIYGVDIDAQAVEVTKLSLLLKVLEGEDEQSVSSQMALIHERVLPNLANNIKCGNSLIAPDFYEGKQLGLLDEEELYRVNAFDWQHEFPEIMKRGGFDAVIGNPPYVSYYSKKAVVLPHELRKYYQSHFHFIPDSSFKSMNTIMLFLEKATKLVHKTGIFSFIIDIGFCETVYQPIRKYLSQYSVFEILHGISVFQGVKSGQIILKASSSQNISSYISVKNGLNGFVTQIPKDEFIKPSFNVSYNPCYSDFIQKISKQPLILRNICDISCGLEYGALRDMFVSKEMKGEKWHKVINGAKNQPVKYRLIWDGDYVLFDKEYEQHLISTKQNYSKSGKYVYLISGDEQKYLHEKLFVRQSAFELIATYDNSQMYALRSVFIVSLIEQSYSLKYILGLINSTLLTFFAKATNIIIFQEGKQPQMRVSGLEKLPIRAINFSVAAEKAQHDKMVELVQQMLDLRAQRAAAALPQARTLLERQIAATDQQIDRLVYALYGLTDEEIKIVEGA